MDATTTHGVFSWNELMTTDPKSAMRFYAELFGWVFETTPMDNGPYHMANVGDTPVAGIMALPAAPGQPGMAANLSLNMPAQWAGYVTVDDVDATASQVERLGGRLLMPATEIPDVGRFAVIQDPQGATLNLITFAKR